MNNHSLCPCGSGAGYGACCQPFHERKAVPSSPERLMRSRYSAFVLNRTDYLVQTWHSSTRPDDLDLTASPEWTNLQILSAEQKADAGRVHFRAVFRVDKNWGCLEEVSSFCREDGRWYYLSGETSETFLRPGRNDRCPCGSQRKYKVCCL
jgi:SEC-C motif-containing protein